MSNFGINFVTACSGGLNFRIQTAEGEIERRADDTADGVYWVERYGIASDCYLSSDMDFASEEGFADDDGAKKFLSRIMNNVCEAA
jgi:hypothetical protein